MQPQYVTTLNISSQFINCFVVNLNKVFSKGRGFDLARVKFRMTGVSTELVVATSTHQVAK